VCFADAIQLVDGRAVIGAGCKGCGRCVEVCPQQAIELSIEHGRFVEESVARISPLVDVS
jgi:Fe-S-cluster-containing hydrogenase component 2